MRHCLLILSCFLATIFTRAQEPAATAPVKKFNAGISYSYIGTTMKYTSFSSHYYWNSIDFGENKLSGEDLDEFNSDERVTDALHTVSLSFGMLFLNKPKWSGEGNVSFGLSKYHQELYNKTVDTSEMTVNSKFSTPSFGLGFKFGYHFTPKWAIMLQPLVFYTWGKITDITDNATPEVVFFDETRNIDFTYLYTRVNLMACFTVKNFTISAGPGIYYLYTTHYYKIERINQLDGYTYLTEFNSKLKSKAMFDGCVAIDWRIIPSLSAGILAAIGADLYIQPVVRFNF